MQLSPRYEGEVVMRIESIGDDPATPLLRQRSRLADELAGLDDDQWAAPTRCDGWSAQDVIAHLVVTNQFWAYSITSGLEGAPSRLLAGFDPVASPAELVEGARSWSAAETLDRFVGSNDQLAGALGAVDDAGWSVLAEAPPGHLSIRLLALHALWDSWIHERDILLPLGVDPVEEPDEISGSLTYVAGLGPACMALGGSTRRGTLEIRVTDPATSIVVEVGPTVTLRNGPAPTDAVTITADAVELLEALSFRRPFPATIADDDRWLLGTLGEVFEQVD